MDKKTDSSIMKFIQSAANRMPGLVTAYLFGSFAKNTQKKESDIDIAFVIENLDDMDKFDLQVQLMLMASEFDSRIEPHPFSLKDMLSGNPFALEVKKTGKEIWQK